jgi:maltodextrin utilization protein YvdJ
VKTSGSRPLVLLFNPAPRRGFVMLKLVLVMGLMICAVALVVEALGTPPAAATRRSKSVAFS